MPKTIRYRVFENPDSASAQVAAEISQLIRERALLGRQVVLGLATGRSPIPLYEELIYLHREERLSFSNVVTFNLDEYVGVARNDPSSFHTFMRKNFFDHVDIPAKQIHFLSGSTPAAKIAAHCEAYEELIEKHGGIDYQILGIGRSGHVGFNEPGSSIVSRTRLVELGEITRNDNARDFGDAPENVPTHALTMGCGTIMEAKRIALLAWGSAKASVVRRAIQGRVSSKVCASYLQKHETACFYLDAPAASLLKGEK